MKQIQHFFVNEVKEPRLMLRETALLNQLKNVLRMRGGERVVLLDGRGARAEAILESLHGKEAVFAVEKIECCAAPTRRRRLFIALPKKPATLEWIVEKATELGVTDIVPLHTARCQVSELRKVDRLQLIIKEGAEQCERLFLPELHGLETFSSLLKSPPSGQLLVGDPWTYDTRLADLAMKGALTGQDLNVVIGPEGGLTTEELAAAREAGARLFQLNQLVLRMETAAIVSLGFLACLEDA